MANSAGEPAPAQAAQRRPGGYNALKPTRKELARYALLFIAAVLLLLVPTIASAVIYPFVTQATGLMVALGAMILGVALMLTPSRVGWTTYPLDWLGAALLASGVALGETALWGGVSGKPFMLGTLVFIYRSEYRRLHPLLVAIRIRDEAAAPPLVRFREDGEQLAIYPSRSRLARHAINAGMLTLIASGLMYLLSVFGPVVMAGVGFFAAVGLLVFLCDLPRLIWRWPALIVTSDGIIDCASAGVTGYGLIPWQEIEAIREEGGGVLGFYAELAIIPLSSSRLTRRLAPLKRIYLDVMSLLTFSFARIYISSLFLSEPPAAIALRVASYVASHAPPGYVDPGDTAIDLRRSLS